MARRALYVLVALLWLSAAMVQSEMLDAESEAEDQPTYAAATTAPTAFPYPMALHSSKFCLGWRNTGGCSGTGPREPVRDETCFKEIPPDRSGYCLCAHGVRVANSNCGHKTLTCHKACADDAKFAASWHLARTPLNEHDVAGCIGWRNTGQCDFRGFREEIRDETCYTEIPQYRSGYCLCAGGVQAGFSNCEKRKPIVCRDVCKNIPLPPLPTNPPAKAYVAPTAAAPRPTTGIPTPEPVAKTPADLAKQYDANIAKVKATMDEAEKKAQKVATKLFQQYGIMNSYQATKFFKEQKDKREKLLKANAKENAEIRKQALKELNQVYFGDSQ